MIRKSQNKGSERGAVLLTTLLIMTLMAALSVALMEDIRFAIKRAAHTQSYAQADWYAVSAEDFAVSYLTQEFANLPPVRINEKLNNITPFIIPIDGGFISLNVRDGSQCFSLARLIEEPARLEFENLLTGLGLNNFAARRISFAAADWIDADSQLSQNGAEDFTYLVRDPAYRTANANFTSVMEIRAINGMSEDIYQKIRPFICARPDGEVNGLNINTMTIEQLPLLAASLGGGVENAQRAENLILNRPPNGYQDATEVLGNSDDEADVPENINVENVTFIPTHIWVEADIRYRNARRVVSMEFAVNATDIRRIARFMGPESRRPAPVSQNVTPRQRNRLSGRN
ncbi:MAG: type II secretion system minor pseudopilin GspK [Litorimonas sp.]